MTRRRIEGGPETEELFLPLPGEAGGEGMQSKREAQGSGEAALLSAPRKRDRCCAQEKRAESVCGKTVAPVHWIQFSLGSWSHGHELGVKGRLAGQRLREGTENLKSDCRTWKNKLEEKSKAGRWGRAGMVHLRSDIPAE